MCEKWQGHLCEGVVQKGKGNGLDMSAISYVGYHRCFGDEVTKVYVPDVLCEERSWLGFECEEELS